MSSHVASQRSQRRLVATATIRVLVITAIAVALYFVLPLAKINHDIMFIALGAGVVALLAYAAIHIWAIINSDHPSIQAVEGFFIFVVLFLVMSAAWYYVISLTYPHSFTSDALTRLDALYFAITIFATVGFGDISAASQLARAFVTAQMVIDLFILGLGIRILTRAVKKSAAKHGQPDTADSV